MIRKHEGCDAVDEASLGSHIEFSFNGFSSRIVGLSENFVYEVQRVRNC